MTTTPNTDDNARREAWAAERCHCGHRQGAHGPHTGCHVAPCDCVEFRAKATR